MKLSVVIVNYNVKYFLEQCINSILASHTNFIYEIIVVDNNSTDESINYLTTKFSQSNINFITNNINVGFSKANNQAITISQGEYVLLLNPDTVLGEKVLTNVIRFMDDNKNAGAVGVKGINGFGEFLSESKRGLPTPWASFCKLSGFESIFPKSKLFGQYSLLYFNENDTHQVPVLVGAFMMIRKAALDKAGLLDEAFFMYGEDIDLSYRILKAGFENYYLPEKIIHYKGESTDMSDPKYTDAFYQAMLIFFKKHYPHYGRFFTILISAGIQLKSLISPLSKRGKKVEENSVIRVLNRGELSNEEIIEIMDKSETKTQFRIFDPKTNITIGSHFTELKN